MKAALFYYDDFAEFEIAVSLLYLGDIKWQHIALENRNYRSLEGQTFVVSNTLDQIDPTQLDLLLIPGGDSQTLFSQTAIHDFVTSCLESGGIVAGICGGAELLAGLGLLKGRRCTGGASGIEVTDPLYPYFKDAQLLTDSVVVEKLTSGTIVTAQGQAYVELAAKLQNIMSESETVSE